MDVLCTGGQSDDQRDQWWTEEACDDWRDDCWTQEDSVHGKPFTVVFPDQRLGLTILIPEQAKINPPFSHSSVRLNTLTTGCLCGHDLLLLPT